MKDSLTAKDMNKALSRAVEQISNSRDAPDLMWLSKGTMKNSSVLLRGKSG